MNSSTKTFYVDQASIRSLRFVALMCLSPGLVVLWACTQLSEPISFEDDFQTSSYLIILVLAALGMTLILFRKMWRKVPPNSKQGSLTIGPDGIHYDVGPHQRNIPWGNLKTAVSVHPKGRKNPAAIWLTQQEDPKVTVSFGLMVARSLQRDFGKPIDRDDGIVIPTVLFGHLSCQPILNTIKPFVESRASSENSSYEQ